MSLRTTALKAWPLFFGLAMMMVGSGLQGPLLGVRATQAGFGTNITGLIMSLYYVGYLLGTLAMPKLLTNVGHIRVFTALAALTSSSILIHGVFVEPVAWGLLRMVSGFSFAGLYIIVESWLNSLATKETRGKILSLYMFIVYCGIVTGQLMLNLADPGTTDLFILCSVLMSISLVPIALSKVRGPEFVASERMTVRNLWTVSPLAVFGTTFSGLATSIIFSIGSVYAAERQFSTAEVSVFMAAMTFGGVTFQLPVGALSDRMDRRKVLLYISAAAAVASLLCYLVSGGAGIVFFTASFLLGGLSMTVYGLVIAYINDHLRPDQFVAASSSMLFMNGFGAIIGPTLATQLMSHIGVNVYFPTLGLIFATVTGFTIYRMTRRAPPVKSEAPFRAGPPEALPTAKLQDKT